MRTKTENLKYFLVLSVVVGPSYRLQAITERMHTTVQLNQSFNKKMKHKNALSVPRHRRARRHQQGSNPKARCRMTVGGACVAVGTK